MRIIPSTVLLLLLSTITYAQSLDKIVDQHLEAIGGKDKWESLEGFEVSLENLTLYGDAIYHINDGTNKSYTQFTGAGRESIVIINDEIEWVGNKMEDGKYMTEEEFDKDVVENLDEIVDIYAGFLFSPFLEKDLDEFRLEKAVKYNKEKHYVISTMETNGNETSRMYIYINKKTGYITKTEITFPTEGDQAMTIETLYDDYQNKDGLVVPFYREQIIGGSMIETVVTTFNPNPKLDESLLVIPEIGDYAPENSEINEEIIENAAEHINNIGLDVETEEEE